jgi:hypothetical protein
MSLLRSEESPTKMLRHSDRSEESPSPWARILRFMQHPDWQQSEINNQKSSIRNPVPCLPSSVYLSSLAPHAKPSRLLINEESSRLLNNLGCQATGKINSWENERKRMSEQPVDRKQQY